MCRNAHARGVPVIRCRSRWPRVRASTAQGRPWRRHASGRPVGVGPNPKGSGLGPRPRMGRSPVPGVGTNPAQSQAQSVPAKARAQLLASYLCRTLRGVWRQCRLAKYLIYLAPRAGFEPATNRLTAGCSTTELPGNSTEAAWAEPYSKHAGLWPAAIPRAPPSARRPPLAIPTQVAFACVRFLPAMSPFSATGRFVDPGPCLCRRGREGRS
jgi:hypothetical protein